MKVTPKVKFLVPLLFGLVIAFSPMLRADHDRDDRANTPLALIGVIGIPGNPISSTDIVWVDQATERLYFTDRGNGPAYAAPPAGYKLHGAVDVIDAENDLYIGRITTGKMGTLFFTGANSADRNLGGPNGVVNGASLTVAAGDGDGTLKIADVNPKSPTYLQIIASVAVDNKTPGVSMCGGPCKRVDELGYDPDHHIFMAASDAPATVPPFVSFISADPPYTLLGQINFAAEGLATGNGLEQPLWIPRLRRFFQTLPKTNPDGTGKIAVVNPVTEKVERTINMDQFNCSPTGEALGDDDHVVVSCGSFPLVIDLDGEEIGPGVTKVGGGDEVNFNPGDGNFVVSSNIDGDSVTPKPIVLGVVNSESGRWLQNVPLPNGVQPGSVRAGNLAAFGENAHVFVVVHPATPPATDVCADAGFVGAGCVAVFAHTGEERNEDQH